MYNYKKDLITIINATTLDKQGIDAVQAAVNLLKHQASYEKYFQQGPVAKANDKNEVMPANRQIANSAGQPVSQARAGDDQPINPQTGIAVDTRATNEQSNSWPTAAATDFKAGDGQLINPQTATTADLQWSADSQKPTDEDKGVASNQLTGEKDLVNNQTATQPALSANNEKDSQASSANLIEQTDQALNLSQYNAIRKFKSVNETIGNELKMLLKNADYEAKLPDLKQNLEAYHHDLKPSDGARVDIFYSLVMQRLKCAQQLADSFQDYQTRMTQLVEQILINNLEKLNDASDTDQLTELSMLIENAKQNSWLKTAKITEFEHRLTEQAAKLNSQNSQSQSTNDQSQTAADEDFQKLLDETMPQIDSPLYDLRKGEYIVKRRLNGAKLLDRNGQQAFFIGEKLLKKRCLQSGDVVKVSGKPYLTDEKFYLGKVVDHQEMPDDNPIEVFSQAVIEKHEDQLVVARDIYGNELKPKEQPVVYKISSLDQEKLKFNVGDIIDLAWYANNDALVDDPQSCIAIRWLYPIDGVKNASQTSAKKHSGKAKQAAKKKPAKAKKHHAFDNLIQQKLKLDLHGQKVGVAIGNGQNGEMLKEVVKSYHGNPKLIDAFSGKRKTLRKQTKNLDILILVTAYASHPSSWVLNEARKDYGIKFAVSPKLAVQSFSKALYRAEHHLTAFEQGNQEVAYPVA